MIYATRMSLLLAALCLAACSEEEAAVQTEPQAEQQTQAPEESPADEGMRNLREGAEQLLEGGRQLSKEALERADKALEDAEPALRRANEAAREVGQAVNELVDRAVRDFNQAVTELEKRVDEAEGTEEPIPGDPDAVLAPADQLNADTRAAAQAVAAGIGPEYVGVWATDAAACGKIDQEPAELFAVITPTTIRRYENVCNFQSQPLSDGSATVQASCIAEGTAEEREITFTLPSPGVLQIGNPQDPNLAELVRCRLPDQQ